MKPAIEGLMLAATTAAVLLALTSSVTRTASSASERPAYLIRVKVQPGDTLWDYAERYGDPNVYILKRLRQIAAVNRMDLSRPIVPGQEILIPVERETVTASAAR